MSPDIDVTGFDVGDRFTPKKLILINFNLFYFLNKGINEIGVKFTGCQWTPIIDGSTHVGVSSKSRNVFQDNQCLTGYFRMG